MVVRLLENKNDYFDSILWDILEKYNSNKIVQKYVCILLFQTLPPYIYYYTILSFNMRILKIADIVGTQNDKKNS